MLNIKTKYKTIWEQWQIGYDVPIIADRVVTFEADGAELKMVMDAMRRSSVDTSKAGKAVEELESLPQPGPVDVSLDRLTDQRVSDEPRDPEQVAEDDNHFRPWPIKRPYNPDPYGMSRAAEFPLVANGGKIQHKDAVVHGIVDVTQGRVHVCACGEVFQSLLAMEKHLEDLVNNFEPSSMPPYDAAEDGPEVDIIRKARRRA